MSSGRLRAEVLADFFWTYAEHGGIVSLASDRLGMSPAALSRALYRARADGFGVTFTDDVWQAMNRSRSA